MRNKLVLGEEAWVEFVDTVEKLVSEHGMSKGEIARRLGYSQVSSLIVILNGRNGPSRLRLEMLRELYRQVKSGEYTPIGDGRRKKARELKKQKNGKTNGVHVLPSLNPTHGNGAGHDPNSVLAALDSAQVQLSQIEVAVRDIERRLERAAENAPRLVQPGLSQIIDKVRDLRALTQEILPFLSYN